MARTVIACVFLASVWTAMLLLGTGALDLDLLRLLYAGYHPVFLRAAWILTQFGGSEVLMPVTALGALLLIVRHDLRGAAWLLGITLSGRILIDLEKAWTARPRPDEYLHLVTVRSDSFPSGHTGNATLVWLTMALLIPRGRFRTPLLWAAALLAVAVGFSRPMLGVHWPSDVVAGWAFGLFWTLFLLALAGPSAGSGTGGARPSFFPERRGKMNKERADDSAIIDEAEGAPGQGGTSGGNLQRDVASRAEQEHEVGEAGGEYDSVTRVHGADKPDKGARPNLPNRK